MLKDDIKIILSRINMLFKRMPNTRYSINIVNDKFDDEYNLFFEKSPRKQRPHSVPIHALENHDLGYLEQVVDEIKKHYQLSINYTGFVGERWPRSQRIIQKKKNYMEN